MNARARSFRREEIALVAVLLLFFAGIVAFALPLPFDARLFPLVIGGAGFLFMVVIAAAELRRPAAEVELPADDPAATVGWPRFLTALLCAPAFGLLLWLFGFVVASLAAMLSMPHLMGYPHRRQIVVVAVITVVVLAVLCPYLLDVNLPRGLVGDWLFDKLFPDT
jgi:tripartite tricarboxylate transporter TctB family protein